MPSTVPFVNWSVLSWGAGRFDLQLSLTDAEVGAIEGGQALLALNSSVLFGSSVLGAAGIIDGAVLSSSTLVGAWWSTVFGIQTPPPDPSFSSLQGIVEDLAWFGASTAGRAAYAATTIVAVLLYLWEGHKLARAKLTGRKPGARREARLMALGADLLLAVAFVAAVGLIFAVATALKSWVFELSPREWGYSVILTFSLGVLAAAYLDGDGTLELLATVPIFLAVVWWVARLWRRHQARSMRASEA